MAYAGMQASNYAAGDYAYMGGNYAAGGIFSTIGKALKTGLNVVAGFATGGVGGAIRAVQPQPRAQLPATLPHPGFAPIPPTRGITIGGSHGITVGSGFGPYVDPGTGMMVTQGANGCGGSCCTPSGKRGRMNKSTYVVRGGGTSRYPAGQLTVIPKGTQCVTPRRMNVANPKALRKAIRRGRGAVKLLRGAAGAMGYSVVTKASLAKRPKARRR